MSIFRQISPQVPSYLRYIFRDLTWAITHQLPIDHESDRRLPVSCTFEPVAITSFDFGFSRRAEHLRESFPDDRAENIKACDRLALP